MLDICLQAIIDKVSKKTESFVSVNSLTSERTTLQSLGSIMAGTFHLEDTLLTLRCKLCDRYRILDTTTAIVYKSFDRS